MRGVPVPPEAVLHGTLPGYRWHKNHGEAPCRPCKVAWARYQQKWAASPAKAKRLRRKEVVGRG